PSSTYPWPHEERSGTGAAGLRCADAAVPSHRRRAWSVERLCSPRLGAALAEPRALAEEAPRPAEAMALLAGARLSGQQAVRPPARQFQSAERQAVKAQA